MRDLSPLAEQPLAELVNVFEYIYHCSALPEAIEGRLPVAFLIPSLKRSLMAAPPFFGAQPPGGFSSGAKLLLE